jgi:phosphoglycerol transferase MdoB-like AlkP superfamily enzyme
METLLRLNTTGGVFTSAILLSLLFSASFSVIFYISFTFFKRKLCCILSSLFLALSALIFSSQLVYYKFFKTFYTLYSAGNSAQVFEFWRDILAYTVKNLLMIALFFLPSIFIVLLENKIFPTKKLNWRYRAVAASCIILFHLVGVAAVYSGSREQNSAYDLYFDNSSPALSVEKLGLITTMRLDMQRLVTGWSPTLKEEFLDIPVFVPSDDDINPSETPESSETSKPDENTDKEEVVEYNTLNIDFNKLISEETDSVLKTMHQYFEKLQPTKKNDYTGKYKGYNLILITAEGFSPYAVRQDVTPTLYKMVHEGYNFTNFYNPIWGVSTSDGEYVACTGLMPKSGVWSFYKSGNNYMPFVMGNQFKALNYKTTAYHNHTFDYYRRDISHPNMGYEYKALGRGLDVKKTWPESDLEMMEKTIPEYISSQPFHTYYMTVSGHMLYNFSGNSMAAKNKSLVQDLPYSEACRAYIAAQIELDKALEYLLKQLELAGIADNTLIALSADHYPYGLEHDEIEELAGGTVEKNFELYKSTFILYTKGMIPETIDKPCSSLDIIPTLSNLLGLDYDSRLLMGRDIFSDSEPLVIFLNKSFITDKGRYNSQTGEFIPVEGVTVESDYRKISSAIVESKFYFSTKILETDYYAKVLLNKP